VAKLTGVSQQTISRMENGRIPIPIEFLDAVAQACQPVIAASFPAVEVFK